MKKVDDTAQPLSGTVLIVDDDQRLLDVIRTRIEAMGCRCITCDNAGEAMVDYAKGGIDLVITDLSMPGVDGLSIIGLIRNESDVPVIVITGHSDDYGRLIHRFPNVSIILKPFEQGVLMRCVRDLLLQGARPDTSIPPKVA